MPCPHLVPEQIEDFQLNWIWRGTFYVMDFKKASA